MKWNVTISLRYIVIVLPGHRKTNQALNPMVGVFLMAIFGGIMANWLSNTVEKIGSTLNLPELGISEFLAGQSQPAGGGGGGSWGPVDVTPPAYTNVGGNTSATPATITAVPSLDQNNQNNLVQLEGPSEQQISEWYQPTLNYLNQAEGFARENAAGQTNLLNSQEQTAEAKLSSDVEQRNQLINSQETQLAQQRLSAENEVTRYTNSLLRAAKNRFGGGSSAGTAAHSIVSEQALRNLAQVSTEHANAVDMLMADRRATLAYYQNTQNEIDDKYESKRLDISTWLNSTLNDIALSKANTEREKIGLRNEALQRASDFMAQQQAQIAADKRALETWVFQQNYLQQQAYNQIVNDAYFSQGVDPNMFNKAAENKLSVTSPSSVQTSIFPRTNKNYGNDDELEQFLALA